LPTDAASWNALGRAYRQSTSHAALAEMEALVEHSLQHPALVIWGSENTLLRPASARLRFRDQRNVKFIEVSGAAHAVHEDQPEAVTDLLLDFLD
jgi:pimeloyl-ACP methyl ester carboxylesterase